MARITDFKASPEQLKRWTKIIMAQNESYQKFRDSFLKPFLNELADDVLEEGDNSDA